MTKIQPELPTKNQDNRTWGSDALAQMMRKLDLKYVAINPGSSFRGLHDSLVNHLGNTDPQILLCLHEEHTVAIAHGWAKVTESPMGAIVHSNVGLMHASMALYNAWCDRAPVITFGATGPVDAAKRRPWIDWIHTSRDQASIVRPYVKWDDQPASLDAAMESMMRASVIARTEPKAPVYIVFDTTIQETELDELPVLPDPAFHLPPDLPQPSTKALEQLESMLKTAKKPVFMMGRVSRSTTDWAARIALVEKYDARVLTDIKTAAAFPTNHPLHVGAPGFFTSPENAEILKSADLIVSFDWVDPAGALKQAQVDKSICKTVLVSMDFQLHNGWSLDHQALASCDLHIAAHPDTVIASLCDAANIAPASPPQDKPMSSPCPVPADADASVMTLNEMTYALSAGLKDEIASFVRLPLGWNSALWHFEHPLDFLGYDGGAGIGSGPGMMVGAAMALQGSGRLPVGVLGDGDYLMGVTALWTAARYGIPMLIIVANNRSFFNDEIHQERVANDRGRPVENKWIGQHIGGPDIDIAAMAQAQGAIGIGPITTVNTLIDAIREGTRMVREGKAVVIDARIEPGYDSKMTKGMTDPTEETHGK